MHIRIVRFALTIPVEDYVQRASNLAPAFRTWPGLLGKWWLGDLPSGTFGGVYLFATREDADWSRSTDLFHDMYSDAALRDVTVDDYDLLDAPTAITAPVLQHGPGGLS